MTIHHHLQGDIRLRVDTSLRRAAIRPRGGTAPQGGYPASSGWLSAAAGWLSASAKAGYPPPHSAGWLPAARAVFRHRSSPPFSPPPGPALPKEAYTSWFTRVAAWFIDSMPVFIVIGIGQGIAIAHRRQQLRDLQRRPVACTSSHSVVGSLVSGLASLLALAYGIWNYGYRQGTTGSTIGKSVMKFKVVSEKTWQPIGFGLSIVRQLAHIVDAIICYIGFLFPLWDAKRQTLADKIMTTVLCAAQPATVAARPRPAHY